MNFKNQVVILILFFVFIGFGAHASDKKPLNSKNLSIANQEPLKASAALDAAGYPWRGLLIAADHGDGNIHHDNVYVQIDGGPVLYQTTIPARKLGNLLPDEGLMWHFYTRDNTEFTIYATSAWVTGLESDLSDPFPLLFEYPVPSTCTEQTVPYSVAGVDQVVNVGDLVTLDGSQSYDAFIPDNEDLSYSWECYSAPESEVLLSDEGKAAVITFTPNQPGNYYFRLTVRDMHEGSTFNRSPIAYLRVSAFADTSSGPYISANAGRTQQTLVDEIVTLDGSQSIGSNPLTSYSWTMENPLGLSDIESAANVFGITGCQGECYRSNYDADIDVDGNDIALLAANYGAIELPDQATVQFTAGIARPHIFRLTVSDGTLTDSETTIVAIHHENASPVLTHPFVEAACTE